MTNLLIDDRDAFARRHPETRATLGGRDWGIIDTGGDSPALLLIPGTLGRADIFWQQIAVLALRLRVIALSYPETGGIADWAGDVIALLDARRIEKAAILGSSLGGYLAQYLAGAHAERISHLFAANTLHSVQGLAIRPPYSADLVAAPIQELRAGFLNAMQAWGEAHPEQADVVELLKGEVAGRIPEGEMRARLAALKHGPELPPVALPADALTVIEATDDPLIPEPMRAAVRARLSGARAFRFLWGGHFPYLLRPDLYAGIIAARLGVAAPDGAWTGDEVLEA
ncbi:alpha/beta hydrolase [Pararhodobacter sp. SW119]|uniref:alpha/beta fold hydrolase n=1 Tax=Pararhodobacter sp. SW119 TaxID=2780075 RepID=UPI001ADFD0A2|nr:alpha/beta hydrolase [Pararhodobacter sp. SW119]